MGLWQRYKLGKLRKQVLNQIADIYINPMPIQQPTQHHPAPPDFDPMRIYPPEPPTQITTEPDPELKKSVEELSREMSMATQSVPPQTLQSSRVDAIKRKIGE